MLYLIVLALLSLNVSASAVILPGMIVVTEVKDAPKKMGDFIRSRTTENGVTDLKGLKKINKDKSPYNSLKAGDDYYAYFTSFGKISISIYMAHQSGVIWVSRQNKGNSSEPELFVLPE
jgi:subtilase family serine protease